MYLYKKMGFSEIVLKKLLSKIGMNMLAIVGENEAPIAVPCCCMKVVSAKLK